MTIEIQMLKCQTYFFRHLDFDLCLAFELWHLSLFRGGIPAPLIPRYVRYIDKTKLTAIINPSYFGKLVDLPIDKIDIIGLK